MYWAFQGKPFLIGLKLNEKKSISNTETSSSSLETLEDGKSYKYLRVLENNRNVINSENKQKILHEIYSRTELLCKSKLNAKNLFKVINEYAISLINYYVGVLDFSLDEIGMADHEIRKILMKYKIHIKPSNKERL